jgi:TupA-like ATPgrasp
MIRSTIARARDTVLEALPLRSALRLEFLLYHKRLPRLNDPHTFNEKIARRKLRDRDPLLATWADKIRAKECAAEILGEEWIIPTLWSGEKLPPRASRNWPIPYVIKASHGSGWIHFVHTAQDEDWDRIEAITGQWLHTVYGRPSREWSYLDLTPGILVEPFLGSGGIVPPDYKFWVFGGRTAYIQVDTNRMLGHQQYFYDLNWKRQSFRYIRPYPEGDLDPPGTLEELLRAAELLAAPFPFVRVDLYEIDGRPRFGEMTFYPNSGRFAFKPESTELQLGRLWPE